MSRFEGPVCSAEVVKVEEYVSRVCKNLRDYPEQKPFDGFTESFVLPKVGNAVAPTATTLLYKLLCHVRLPSLTR